MRWSEIEAMKARPDVESSGAAQAKGGAETKGRVWRNKDKEHRLQVACVTWFHYQYQTMKGLLFAVPNGGRRDERTAAKLKAEGVVAGVSDLILLYPSKEWHGLCIEMKTEEKGSGQSESQKAWQKKVEERGYRYEVVRTKEQFMELIKTYIG